MSQQLGRRGAKVDDVGGIDSVRLLPASNTALDEYKGFGNRRMPWNAARELPEKSEKEGEQKSREIGGIETI